MSPQERCSAPSSSSHLCRAQALCSLLFLAFAFLLSCSPEPALALASYQNYTVGDDNGWQYSGANAIDYQKWAAGKSFSLGDFLLFHYPQQIHDVIVTYNKTVYDACDYLDSNDNDYEVWGEAGNSTFSAVPLVGIGMNYFFCGAESGQHCKGGMKFVINVTHGLGLPASLMIPPPAPSDQTPSDSNTPTSPDTTQASPSDLSASAPTSAGIGLHIYSASSILLPPFLLWAIFV